MANNRKEKSVPFVGKQWIWRISAILVGLVLLQYLNWMNREDNVLMPETISLMKLALLTNVGAYFIPRIPVWLRGIVQIAAIVITTAVYLDFSYFPLSRWDLPALQDYAIANFSQIEPFIWFTLGTWAVFILAMQIMRVPIWMYIVQFGSILLFCIRDSFSNLSLWREVAALLFCFSLMFVVSHIIRLQKNSPDAWGKLFRRPYPVLIPVIVMALIFTGIVSYAPSVRPIITDPYTAWMQSRGETVAKFLDEDGAFPATIINTESGYSRTDSQLGGGFTFNYSEVLQIESTQRTYWRGETRTVYTGKGWERGEDEQAVNSQKVSLQQPLVPSSKFDVSKSKLKEIEYTVTVTGKDSYPVLFGGLSMNMLDKITGSDNPESRLDWTPEDQVLHLSGDAYPTKYTMKSLVPIIDPEALRTVQISDIDRDAFYPYLDLSGSMPARIRTFAAEITANAVTPYDKVKAIERYLSETYTYTNSPAKGKNEDFVYQFLFEIQEGYCDYFSTAMAVLTRSIGMPSRWVKGFSSGNSQLDEMIERGMSRSAIERISGPDTYSVRNSDAHSWVEVYFPGYGWIPFEPTAGFSMPTVYDASVTLVVDEKLPDVNPIDLDAATAGLSWTFWAFIVASAALLAIVLYLLVRFVPWNKVHVWLMKQRRADNFNQAILNDVNRMLRYAKRKGYLRHEHETLREALTRWTKDSVWLKSDLDSVLRYFERAKYSSYASSQKDWIDTGDTIRRLKSAMK